MERFVVLFALRLLQKGDSLWDPDWPLGRGVGHSRIVQNNVQQ